ncbi:hypothetical protein MMYC01_202710 [Madurella mycetomatis]|uniref:Uncharacterized protein n=1 Tax=Madurella mycetomatis TaxID=100816 RepID=A0A175WAJ7_9PEZI|nr:hypothetical protein MMYC01_202710 [Madurella mycetomatis]
MRLLLAVLAGLVLPVAAQIEFINPPPYREADADPSLNPVYRELTSLNVAWTLPESGDPVSVRITALNHSEENAWIVRNSVRLSMFMWTVATTTNLSLQNQFFFSIYEGNSTEVTAFSRIFNITRSEETDEQDPPTSTDPADPPGITSNDPPAVPTEGSSSGLSQAAQIGLGVGIPLAVILGVVAGWLLFGRRRNQVDTSGEPMLQSGHAHGGYSHGDHPNDAPGGWTPSTMTAVPSAYPTSAPVPAMPAPNKQYPAQPVEVSAQDTVYELSSGAQR